MASTTTTETNSSRYELLPEDADRMARLSEEIRSRLLEMTLITGRTVGVEFDKDATIQFVPHKHPEHADVAEAVTGGWMEIVKVFGHDACYGVIAKKGFIEWPCGS